VKLETVPQVSLTGDLPEHRYRRDPKFKLFVDVIESMLQKAEMSPSEVREGAMLACIHFEMRRTAPEKT